MSQQVTFLRHGSVLDHNSSLTECLALLSDEFYGHNCTFVIIFLEFTMVGSIPFALPNFLKTGPRDLARSGLMCIYSNEI